MRIAVVVTYEITWIGGSEVMNEAEMKSYVHVGMAVQGFEALEEEYGRNRTNRPRITLSSTETIVHMGPYPMLPRHMIEFRDDLVHGHWRIDMDGALNGNRGNIRFTYSAEELKKLAIRLWRVENGINLTTEEKELLAKSPLVRLYPQTIDVPAGAPPSALTALRKFIKPIKMEWRRYDISQDQHEILAREGKAPPPPFDELAIETRSLKIHLTLLNFTLQCICGEDSTHELVKDRKRRNNTKWSSALGNFNHKKTRRLITPHLKHTREETR